VPGAALSQLTVPKCPHSVSNAHAPFGVGGEEGLSEGQFGKRGRWILSLGTLNYDACQSWLGAADCKEWHGVVGILGFCWSGCGLT
jgi:hypothetical protein